MRTIVAENSGHVDGNGKGKRGWTLPFGGAIDPDPPRRPPHLQAQAHRTPGRVVSPPGCGVNG